MEFSREFSRRRKMRKSVFEGGERRDRKSSGFGRKLDNGTKNDIVDMICGRRGAPGVVAPGGGRLEDLYRLYHFFQGVPLGMWDYFVKLSRIGDLLPYT